MKQLFSTYNRATVNISKLILNPAIVLLDFIELGL